MDYEFLSRIENEIHARHRLNQSNKVFEVRSIATQMVVAGEVKALPLAALSQLRGPGKGQRIATACVAVLSVETKAQRITVCDEHGNTLFAYLWGPLAKRTITPGDVILLQHIAATEGQYGPYLSSRVFTSVRLASPPMVPDALITAIKERLKATGLLPGGWRARMWS